MNQDTESKTIQTDRAMILISVVLVIINIVIALFSPSYLLMSLTLSLVCGGSVILLIYVLGKLKD